MFLLLSAFCTYMSQTLPVHTFSCRVLRCLTFFFFHRLAKIKEWVDANDPGAVVIPVSGALESKLLDIEDEEEKIKYCESLKTQR